MKKHLHVIKLGFAFVGVLCLSANSYAANKYKLTSNIDNDLTQKIESTLLLESDGKTVIQPKSDINFDPNKSHQIQADSDSTLIDIVINDRPTKVNADIRTKEKIAYNAANAQQYEASIELFKQVIDAEPDNYYAMFSLATIYQKLGQFSKAKALYFKLLQNNPENKEEIIGSVLSLMIEESPKQASYVISRLAMQNPNSAFMASKAAQANAKVKQYDQAISFIRKSLAIEPDNLEYKYNLALIYDEAQDYQKALSSYSDVVKNYKVSANNIPLDQIRARMETLKDKV